MTISWACGRAKFGIGAFIAKNHARLALAALLTLQAGYGAKKYVQDQCA